MGRRKIEIKPIKDDRNRSVTFLKRKGGLFKKAHELSVLCSVDVAVIIFGGNKKLYQYCSGDVNEIINRHSYYETAHETKGPGDFGKKDLIDDDDDDDAIVAERAGSHSSTDHPLPQHHMQHPPPHLNRQHTASTSPPNLPKALVPPAGYGVGPRVGTPQPMTRPSSRNQLGNGRRNSSNLVPPNGYPASQSSHQNGYSYMQHPPAQHPPQHPPHHQQPQHHQPPSSVYSSQMMQPSNLSQMQYPQNHYQQPNQPPQAAQAQPDPFINGPDRRQSMPPGYPTEPPVTEGEPSRPEPPPPPMLEPKRAPAKSRSMFTPIGPSESMLAAHFGFGQESRSQTVDVGALSRKNAAARAAEEKPTSAPAPPPAPITIPPPPVTTSPPPLSRNNSMADPKSAGMRPKLKVHIPTDQEDAGSPETSPRDTSGNTGNASTRPGNENGPVVLPPPSPSHSVGALLSAGATGPVNPFSRPLPSNSQPEQTPMSALPSRFTDAMLPSPSGFYSDWMGNMGFSRSGPGGSDMLPSPLNFQTPIGTTNPAPFFKAEPETNGNKRRSPEPDSSESLGAKRVKRESSI